MTIRIHFVGVKGTGMSALAQISAKMEQAQITGSDVAEWFFTDNVLAKAGIKALPFSPNNVNNADLVVASAAYGKDHPEIVRATELGIPVLSYAEYLGRLMSTRRGVCIAGTHGKTTTTAMISLILLDAGLDPSVVVGSDVPVLGGNAYAGNGDLFVAESCEYRRHFLNYQPEFLVILNIELDHPDYFRDLEDVISAFQELAAKVPPQGMLVAWGDDPNCRRVKAKVPVVTFGWEKHNTFRAANPAFLDGNSTFEVLYAGRSLGLFSLGTSGKHNILNALAAIALCRALGVSDDSMRSSLAKFTGTKRRFEKLGEYNGALVLDDYAHHPTEISATLEGARQAYPDRRIVVVFQPHTFTRTEKLFDDFSKCFSHADQVVIANIFASAREKNGSGAVSAATLAEKIRDNGVEACFLNDFQQIKSYLVRSIEKDDLVLTMGAGDIYKVGLDLLG